MKPFPIAMVTSRFNEKITQLLHDSAHDRLANLGVPENFITSVWVPGAGEIPLLVQHFAKSHRYKAIIVLGCIIRGETSHYDYVCQRAINGCQQVMLEYHVPVISGILTTDNEEQAFARAGGPKGDTGAKVVDAAFEMVELMEKLK